MLTGIASTGISVERQLRRKAKMISATSANAMKIVSSTSRIERRTKVREVVADLDRVVGRRAAADLLEPAVELVGDRDRVGVRLRDHGDADHRHAARA